MGSDDERLSKIIRLIRNCKLGINDISRVETNVRKNEEVASPIRNNSETTPSYPRFNMPFECGLFFGARHFGVKRQKEKQILILDSVEFRFQKTMSDISGKDPGCHNNDPILAIGCVRRFLSDKLKDGNRLPGEEAMTHTYADFQKKLPALLSAFEISAAEIRRRDYWSDYVKIVDKYLERKSRLSRVRL